MVPFADRREEFLKLRRSAPIAIGRTRGSTELLHIGQVLMAPHGELVSNQVLA